MWWKKIGGAFVIIIELLTLQVLINADHFMGPTHNLKGGFFLAASFLFLVLNYPLISFSFWLELMVNSSSSSMMWFDCLPIFSYEKKIMKIWLSTITMNSTPKYVLASLVTYFKTWPRKEKERKGVKKFWRTTNRYCLLYNGIR